MRNLEALLNSPQLLSNDKIIEAIADAIQLEAVGSIGTKVIAAILFIGILILIDKTIPSER